MYEIIFMNITIRRVYRNDIDKRHHGNNDYNDSHNLIDEWYW